MRTASPLASPAYQAALDYMYSFIDYERHMPPSREHARFNFDRMRWLLGQLDEPQRRFPSVVVAGTKGKGSTCAMIEAILRASGYRTGLFTSPHLHSWRERIQVDRKLIAQESVVALVGRIKPLVERLPPELGRPTVFELATAMAFVFFAEQRIEVAVLEIGMGGRYDTVNIVTPRVSAITPISFDHMAVLGPTLAEIASAKAGILKPGVPAVIAPQAAEARAVIEREAGDRTPLWQADPDALRPAANVAESASRPYPLPISSAVVRLRGAHQLDNARVAAGAVMLLDREGLPVRPEAFAAGLGSVTWPGRFEVVDGQPAFAIDGAMNAASAARLRAALAEIPHDRLILVLGTSRDKDIGAIAAELVPHAAAVVITRSRHPRSADAETLAAAVEPLLDGPLFITDDIPPAIEKARQLANEADLICVAGSLFVAAAAREALGLPAVID